MTEGGGPESVEAAGLVEVWRWPETACGQLPPSDPQPGPDPTTAHSSCPSHHFLDGITSPYLLHKPQSWVRQMTLFPRSGFWHVAFGLVCKTSSRMSRLACSFWYVWRPSDEWFCVCMFVRVCSLQRRMSARIIPWCGDASGVR